MKFAIGFLLALALSPFALAIQEDPGVIDPVPIGDGKCCVPAFYAPPPPSFSCPSGTFCGTPTCSGTTGASLGGLNCIDDAGTCSQEQETLFGTNIPAYKCQTRFLGQNICMQVYPKYTCVWVATGGTGTGFYSGNFCGQADDVMCD